MRSFLARIAPGLLLVAALLLVPGTSWATTHTPDTFPPISAGYPQTAHPAFGAASVQNLMMYDVTVAVDDTYNDSSHDAVIGFMTQTDYAGVGCVSSALWNYSHTARFQSTFTSRTWRLYNFQPSVAYEYVVRLGPKTDGSYSYTCGSLGTPGLPTDLGYLNLMVNTRTGVASDYVMFDTDDCAGTTTDPTGGKRYLVLVDTNSGEIVWYLDIPAVSVHGGSTLTGWRYQTGDSGPSTNRILGTVDHGFLYVWGWDGSVIDYRAVSSTNCDGGSSATGPCYSHDAFKSDDTDRTYVVSQELSGVGKTSTDWDSACMVMGRFVDDGYEVSNGALATVNDQRFLMADVGYDPTSTTDGANAPTPCTNTYWTGYFNSTYSPFDWMHVNSIAASDVGGDEVVDLSLRAWDQVIRINTDTSATWTLSPHSGYSDPTLAKASGITGDTWFQGQHDVHPLPSGQLLMLDNQGDVSSGASRGLRINLTGGDPPTTATIQKSWSLVDDAGNELYCAAQGSAEVVDGTSGANVLAMCNEEHTIVESNDSDGIGNTLPLLAIWLPVTSPRTFCTDTSHGPLSINAIGGWYRAFPVETVGEF